MTNKVFVTGSAGFIGTQTCIDLREKGYDVWGVDLVGDNSNSQIQDTFDSDKIKDILIENNIKTVIHFAADHEVGRSMSEPSVYYHNNIIAGINFLENCIKAGVENFIFSSSSSVYGDTESFPTVETTAKNPMSPYARTKSIFEDILLDYEKAYGINTLSLRYFNAGGADPELRNGYVQEPQSHVIPILARTFGLDETFTINGLDYDTPDGTCIRDYTHVCDLASAHVAAVSYMIDGGTEKVFNIGKGNGESVLEVFKAFRHFTKKTIPVMDGPRREGDVAKTFADISLAKKELNWEPQYTLHDMVRHAVNWENRDVL
tara:strand:- start:3065 stop:4018 length:954 start_codon:yes stop_codon:yes gene_type:complete